MRGKIFYVRNMTSLENSQYPIPSSLTYSYKGSTLYQGFLCGYVHMFIFLSKRNSQSSVDPYIFFPVSCIPRKKTNSKQNDFLRTIKKDLKNIASRHHHKKLITSQSSNSGASLGGTGCSSDLLCFSSVAPPDSSRILYFFS